jgi:hypothetical protein
MRILPTKVNHSGEIYGKTMDKGGGGNYVARSPPCLHSPPGGFAAGPVYSGTPLSWAHAGYEQPAAAFLEFCQDKPQGLSQNSQAKHAKRVWQR